MPTFRFDNEIPVPSGDPVKDIRDLRGTMYRLVENLQYMFNNLDESNLGDSLSSIIKFGDENQSAKVEIDVDGIVAEVRKKVGGDYAELSAKVELTASGLSSTTERVKNLEDNQGKVDENLKTEIIQSAKSVTLSAVAETYETKSNAQTTKENLESSISTSANGVLSTVSQTYETKTDATKMRSDLESAIQLSANGVLTTVSGTYETITNVNAVKQNLADNYYSKTTIDQKMDGIKLSVNTNGKEISLTLNGSTQKIDLSGYVSFTNLSTAGQTTINGGNIVTGTISAERLELSSRKSQNGYTFETLLRDGMLLSVRHTGNIFTSSNPACALDPVEGLSLGTYGTAYGEIYTSGNVLKIKGTGGIHLNDKAFPSGFSLSEFNNNLKLSNFSNDLSLSNFSNNAIAMATAYTTTANITGGKDIDMSSITEKDSVGVFSRARYSSYGYGILCSKAGYYLVSAHANLAETTSGNTTTIAIRKVTGGTSTFLARATQYHGYGTGNGYCVNIEPMVVYLDANSYLSLYNSDSGSKTNGSNGCHLTAVYLGI